MNALTLKRTALAVAFVAAAGSASAAPTAGDLVLLVYDAAHTTTYLRDLGVAATAFTDTAGQSFATDANFATFLTGVGSGTSALQWEVVSASGANATYSVLMTETNVPAVAGLNANINVVGGGLLGMYTLLASKATAGSNSYVTTTSDLLSTLDYAFLGVSGLMLTKDAVGLGSSASFDHYQETGRATNTVTPFTAGTWTLSSTGAVTYGTLSAPAVPEPGTWALFAAGLLTVGAIARRRAV